MGEEGRRKQAVNGQLCRAAHERRKQNGHFAVALRGQGAACHHAGHGAAKADEHGHDAAAGKADAAQQLIHHKGHTRHVAGILQHGEEEEQHHDDGQKAQHAAHAGKDAVDDQRVHRRVDIPVGQSGVHNAGQGVDAHFHEVLEEQADDVEGEEEHQTHNGDKRRDGGVLAGKELVDAVGAQLLLALMGLDHRLRHQLLNEGEPHIRNGGGAVQPALLLHLHDDMFDHFFFVGVQLQRFFNAGVTLHQLGGGKTHRDARCLGVILDEVQDAVDAAVHRAAVVILAAKIHPPGALLILCHMDGVVYQLVHALVLGGRDGDDRDAQHRLHLVDAHRAAVAAHFVHHVQRQHHGDIQLHQLHGQVEVALDVGGIHDVDDAGGLFADDELPGDDLLTGIGGHGIDARQVSDLGLRVPLDGTALAVHRHARKVADVLVGTGELVEQGSLAAVLVARQRKGQGLILRQGMLPLLGVVLAALAKTRVLHHFSVHRGVHRRGLFGGGHGDLCRVVQTQGQLIAVDAQLHGVAHGRQLYQRDLRPGDQTHIQKVLPQCACTAHGLHYGAFADL